VRGGEIFTEAPPKPTGEKVVVPNSQLMKGKFTVLLDPDLGVTAWRRWVWFNVDYSVAPALVVSAVERAVAEADIANVAKSPAPSCVAMDFVPGSVRYAVRYWLVDLDVRGAGLSVWQDAEHTGMDNHYERAGRWTGKIGFCEGVDLNCYLVRECRAFAVLAEQLGFGLDAAEFSAAAECRSAAIRRDLWNEADGFYYDRHAKTDAQIPVKYAGAFLPLWAGVSTKEQAVRLVDNHLLNPAEFWRPYPIPALAATEPGYVEGFPDGESTGCCSWRAHTWLPTNYMIFHGLRHYGYDSVAAELAARTWRMFMRGRFSEYYTSESGIGTGRKPFWGWTCLALFLPHENELGLDPTILNPANTAIQTMRKQIAALQS
ncbi:MAG: trehalase family glycosidase, partial [Lentisphaerota bacterium]